MIFTTITLNPCIDRREYFDCFCSGAVNRPTRTVLSAGGKGINVAKTLCHLIEKEKSFSSSRVGVLTFAGKGEGEVLKALLSKEFYLGEALSGIQVIDSEFQTRTCTKLITKEGVTEINETGYIGKREIEALIHILADLIALPEKRVVILSGSSPKLIKNQEFSTNVKIAKSFPQDVENNVENLLITLLESCGIPVLVDTSGESLVESLKASPSLIKPNQTELEALHQGAFESEKELVEYCRELYVDNGCEILCTLGENGAIFVGKEGIFKKASHRVFPCDPTGAGDTYLASFAYARYEKKLSAEACLIYADEVTREFLMKSLQ
ncbi:MAG: hypothetical protein IJW46_06070 [Clostridia bacterium]|nr:hypothetical protein [Clostridia bacterium]